MGHFLPLGLAGSERLLSGVKRSNDAFGACYEKCGVFNG